MVTAAHVDSSIGQGSDLLQTRDTTILSVEEQLDVFRLKTGSAIRLRCCRVLLPVVLMPKSWNV
jgi:hypothetical protein